jgi:TPP-dependent trihydroxycyclohexane-1,2-dione (THcHDO) dehydratase
MNIQRLEIDPSTLSSFYESEEYRLLSQNHKKPDVSQIQEVIHEIQLSQRPVILVG